MKKSEIRKHYFEDRYVIFSPKRSLRPTALIHETLTTIEDKGDPFDPERQKKEICTNCEVKRPEYEVLDERGNWLIRAVPNKFSAISLDNPKAYGKQEVIIETPRHGVHLNDLSVGHIVKVFDAYENRNRELMKLPRIRYVAIFKNEGGKAGASINHAHSQVYALPLIPPLVSSEAVAYENYFLEAGRCPYDDVIRKEIRAKERVFFKDDFILGICPYASSSAYGVWLLPREHVRRLEDLSKKGKESLARALKIVLDRLESLNLAYNYFVRDSMELENQHFVLKVEPRPNIWAGFELSTGIPVNPVLPEEAAELYRKDVRRLAGHPVFKRKHKKRAHHK